MNKLFGLFLLALAFLVPVSMGRATLVTLPSPVFWPGLGGNINSTPQLQTLVTVSAAGHYGSYIFAAKEDMVISHVGFRAGTATGSPTIEVRIETVATTGLPSGTLWATNTNGTTGTITSDTNVLQSLTASATITKGQVFCVKIAYASGTSQTIQMLANVQSPVATILPYQVINTGTPTKGTLDQRFATISLGSSSTTFYQLPGALPVSVYTAGTFNNSVAGAKRGLRFTIPMNCRAIGLRNYTSTTTGDVNVTLFDDAGNELSSSSTAYDGDQSSNLSNGASTYFFDNTVTLTAGTTYRIAIEPTSATNTLVSTYTLPSANYRGATPLGTTGHYTTFTTAGGWIDTATDQVPLMDLIIDQVDNGAGTGGGGGRIIGG